MSFLATDVDKDALKLILAAGAPTSSPDDADRLLHAVRDIVASPGPLSVRAGVNRCSLKRSYASVDSHTSMIRTCPASS